MINFKVIGAAAVGAVAIGLSVGSVAPVEAATLNFNFSFANSVNGGGNVTGIVRGLTDNTTSAATSVEVLSNTAGFGIGEYVSNPFRGFNNFTVMSGAITSAFFGSFGFLNTPPAVTNSSLGLAFNDPRFGTGGGLLNNPGQTGVAIGEDLTFTTPATAVPTPALLPGLIGLGVAALRKRKSQKVEAKV